MGVKPVKILHTADLHLGNKQYGFPQREQDFYDVTVQIFALGIAEKVDAIIIAGDIFDSMKPPDAAVLMLQTLVKDANAHGIQVLGIDGNHDCCDSGWLRVCGIKPLDGVLETVRGITVTGINSARPAVFNDRLSKLKEIEASHGPIHILVVHQALAELAGFANPNLTALQIATVVAPLGVQYVALGDIHTYAETVIGGIRFAYSGSPEVNAVDEAPNKCVSMLTCDLAASEIKTTVYPLTTRPFLNIQLGTEGDLHELYKHVTVEPKPLVIARYPTSARELAKRAEDMCKDSGCMYRLMPYADLPHKTLTVTAHDYDRRGALIQLKEAVTAYFEPESDEYQLVFQLLENAENTKDIIAAFKKSKGL